MAKLTQQQETFCKLYVKYGIGRKAYMEAYPTAKEWKENSVDCAASKLLNNAKVTQRINELNAEIESTLKTSLSINKRKLIEYALTMLEETNNPAERTHAVNLVKMLFQKEGLLQPQNQVNVQINNNNITAEVADYLNL